MSKPELIYLVHRMPYPPDKGDKIRSYHILRYLLQNYRVHLGCFVDAPEDMQHVAALEEDCESVYAARLNPMLARARSAKGFLTGESLSLPYYRNPPMRDWVKKTLKDSDIQAAVVFSSPMAQYLMRSADVTFPRVMDFVDVDSDKWQQYADTRRGFSKWLYSREARTLLDYERRVAGDFDASVFVSPNETDLFSTIAPDTLDRHYSICNGVAYDYFDPDVPQDNPFADTVDALVFTGMMDYWPNVDAVKWFANDVFPDIQEQRPNAEFWIVGGSPTQEVQELQRLPNVHVTGRVPDVRPYILHAKTVVAPLRIARGIQNKVLEALAMGKPTVCTPEAAAGLDDLPQAAASVSGDDVSFASLVLQSFDRDEKAVREAARSYVVDNYDWDRNLGRLDSLLASSSGTG